MTAANANLAVLLVEKAAATPDTVALRATERDRERAVSYAELADRAARGAALLHARGLRAGDAALIFQPVSVDLYVILLAIFRLGLRAMFADPSVGLTHLARCCALGSPRAFIGPPRAHALRWLSGPLRRIEVPIVTGRWPFPPGTARWRSLEAFEPRDEIALVAADAPALLTFTSGSTGQPKTAVRSHGFLRAQHRALEAELRLTTGETDLATLPVFVLANLASGISSVLADADLRHPGKIDPDPVAKQIQRLQPTRTAASPAFLECLLESAVPLGSFRQIYTGGAPVFPDLLERLVEAAAPGAEIVAVYGSTEAEPMASFSARDLTDDDLAAMRGGDGLLAGTPVPSVRLRVMADRWGTPLGSLSDPEFAALRCPPGVIGEIVVTGDHVLKGYLHGHGDEETKFRAVGETWHRTGDAGRLDDRGRLWLVGRCTAKVSDAVGVQYPLAVECAARLHAARVRRCAFVAWRGKRCLLIESKIPLTEPETARLKMLLFWAHLADIRCLPRIPVDRRHNAKIDYVALSGALR